MRPALLLDHNIDDEIYDRLLRLDHTVNVTRARDEGVDAFPDDKLLEFAAESGCIVVSYDVNSLVGIAKQRMSAGLAMTGLLMISRGKPMAEIVNTLLIVSGASDAYEWNDVIEWIPY